MSDSLLNSVVGLGAMLVVVAALNSPWVRRSTLWTVTVTPLASIIGSGFLISAPVLYDAFGRYALVALVLVNLLSLGIGLAIRHNIQYFDPDRPAMMRGQPVLGVLGRLASGVLVTAYVISVAFYISLLSAFALAGLGYHSHVGVKLSGTALLLVIGAVGYRGGLHGLEALEKVAVNCKMAIIGGLLVVLAVFNVRNGSSISHPTPSFGTDAVRKLGGLLIITQGFETTKYMAKEYAIKPRLRAMVFAQLTALGVYVAFVLLVGPLVVGVDAKNETAIIAIVAKLSAALGIALSLGAVFSQFSAAVADTVGAGGIAQQEIKSPRFSVRHMYPVVALAAAITIWAFNVFTVMAFASRAFAAYYALQCAIASITAFSRPSSAYRLAKLVGFPLLGATAATIAVFAIPAE